MMILGAAAETVNVYGKAFLIVLRRKLDEFDEDEIKQITSSSTT